LQRPANEATCGLFAGESACATSGACFSLPKLS
jgi:hypothetical protein